jgi:hypothetical protein
LVNVDLTNSLTPKNRLLPQKKLKFEKCNENKGQNSLLKFVKNATNIIMFYFCSLQLAKIGFMKGREAIFAVVIKLGL